MSQLLPMIDPNVWMEVSAAVFLVMFTWLVFWVYSPARKSYYDRRSKMPLSED